MISEPNTHLKSRALCSLKAIVILVTCLTFYGTSAFSDEALSSNDQLPLQKLMQLSPANLGFFNADDSKVCHIAHVGSSVFTLINPAGEKKVASELTSRLGIESSYETLLSKLVEVKSTLPDNEQIDIELLSGQVSICKSRKVKLSSCEIFIDFSKGTAFLAGQERLLWTALHNVRDLIKSQLDEGVLDYKGLSLPFALLDSSGRVVYNSISNPATVETLNLSYFDLQEIDRTNSCVAMTRDWIGIRLSKSIGEPLKISQKLPSQSRNLYLVGYPKKTDDRSGYKTGLTDSDGVSLYFTIGKQRSNISDLLELEPCFKGLGNEKNNIIYIDGDGANGLSGAPLVNDQAEVVGVYNFSFPFDGRAIFYHTSYIYSFKGIFEQVNTGK